ncbi:CocE/NonD family hydrolase [Pseudofrankia inefficax]|nr:CocE/NonD family hydrolase [Pseudofrankia inefficax]
MRDGVRLAADVYQPVSAPLGTLLMRGPYGRGVAYSTLARQLAARGYQVVFVSSRGTFDSEGYFDAMRVEAADGQDVVVWMRAQPWYTGTFGTVGVSYLGFTEWALFADPPRDLKAAAVFVGPHDFAEHSLSTGTYNLDIIGWAHIISRQETSNMLSVIVDGVRGTPRVRQVMAATSILEAVDAEFQGRVPWLREWLTHPDLADPHWGPARFGSALETVDVPVLIVSGWMDIFTRQSHEQYRRLSARGVDVALTVGPWTHGGSALARAPFKEILDWLDAKVGGLPVTPRPAPVHLHVTGAGEWRHLDTWPPKSSTRTLRPHADGRLDETQADGGEEMTFTYDPADPTPTLGGATFTKGGYVKDGALARRNDVLAFTTEPLDVDLEVMGTPVVTLDDRTEHPDADLCVRISDVDSRGTSRNVADGYLRVRDATGPIRLDLSPVAHRFKAGHRIRLLVAGGSFPRYARNPGTGENPMTARTRLTNRHTIALATSRLDLPVPS